MDLSGYSTKGFSRGRPLWFEALWQLVQFLFVSSRLPGTKLRVVILRMFGARMGRGVVIKPGVRVKFPWRLSVGDYSWIGEDVCIDNLALVSVGSNCCISQGSYLCTGSHDWSRRSFDLIVKPIRLEEEVWVCARSTIAPGVVVGAGAVLALGSVATKSLEAWTIYAGCPARPISRRVESYGVGKEIPSNMPESK